ncbi:MAG: glycosyltransferase [Mycobacteriales bacterium]
MGRDTPLITVLMATYNGMPFLPDQVTSILDQGGVRVELFVSDDQSADGTWEWLQGKARDDTRIRLLPRVHSSGGYAANFYRLVRDVDFSRRDLIAFSDQDDIWSSGKLAHQAALIRTTSADGVSSNVTATSQDGRRFVIRKSYPRRRFDYLFESAGPGSTFIFARRVAVAVQRLLAEAGSVAGEVQSHDWLVYAVCRAQGWRWLIDEFPWVEYRQHDFNALGANHGIRSALRRLDDVRRGWHRAEALKVACVAAAVAPQAARADLERLEELLADRRFRSRWRLVRHVMQMRRRPRDQWLLGGMIASGLW